MIGKLPLCRQLLFVLSKLRNSEDLKSLAFRFNISTQSASTIFNSWIHYMFDAPGEISVWPHSNVISQNMPESCKADFPSTYAKLDCTELKIEKPTSLVLQSLSFSNYKSTNMLKSQVACDPHGAVIYLPSSQDPCQTRRWWDSVASSHY